MSLRNTHYRRCLCESHTELFVRFISMTWATNTPFDKCDMVWISKVNHPFSLSLCLLVEFCVKAPEPRWSGNISAWGRGAYFLMSTVVTVNFTPFSHKTMKSLWQKGQFPTFSPSCPAWGDKTTTTTTTKWKKTPQSCFCDCTNRLISSGEYFQHFSSSLQLITVWNWKVCLSWDQLTVMFHVEVKSSCFCRK